MVCLSEVSYFRKSQKASSKSVFKGSDARLAHGTRDAPKAVSLTAVHLGSDHTHSINSRPTCA